MRVLCLDLGNTSLHAVVVQGGRCGVAYRCGVEDLMESLALWRSEGVMDGLEGVAFCSVVPALTDGVLQWLQVLAVPVFHLTHGSCPVPISYPAPAEVGQDRLANGVFCSVQGVSQVMVIDLGTATNFDLYSQRHGYEGGIIAPGFAMMTEYLHEKTALLPRLEREHWTTDAVFGRSTVEAMQVGCDHGYAGMVRHLLERLMRDWVVDESGVQVWATGGHAQWLQQRLPDFIELEDNVTILGLYHAFVRTR